MLLSFKSASAFLLSAFLGLTFFGCVASTTGDESEDEVTQDATEPQVSEQVFGGGACGAVTCSKGTYCCNASCGTCVKPGNYCTQQVCNSTE